MHTKSFRGFFHWPLVRFSLCCPELRPQQFEDPLIMLEWWIPYDYQYINDLPLEIQVLLILQWNEFNCFLHSSVMLEFGQFPCLKKDAEQLNVSLLQSGTYSRWSVSIFSLNFPRIHRFASQLIPICVWNSILTYNRGFKSMISFE